jgi:hypothetical protein
MQSTIESMSELLGSDYKIITTHGEPIVVMTTSAGEIVGDDLVIFGDDDLAKTKNPVIVEKETTEDSEISDEQKKTIDEYIFQFYLGSLTVVGLFILFRMIQKSR